MQRKSSEPLQKVTMNFFASDYTWMADRFPTGGAQKAIRELVRQFRTRSEAKTASEVERLTDELEIEL